MVADLRIIADRPGNSLNAKTIRDAADELEALGQEPDVVVADERARLQADLAATQYRLAAADLALEECRRHHIDPREHES